MTPASYHDRRLRRQLANPIFLFRYWLALCKLRREIARWEAS